MGKRRQGTDQWREECALARQRSYEHARIRREKLREGELPYSFSYKIRHAFIGERCPVCGVHMGVAICLDDDPIVVKTPMPSVQHNIPLSKGGKHILSNISVICNRCNTSIGNRPTGPLNNWLVVKKWREINER